MALERDLESGCTAHVPLSLLEPDLEVRFVLFWSMLHVEQIMIYLPRLRRTNPTDPASWDMCTKAHDSRAGSSPFLLVQ